MAALNPLNFDRVARIYRWAEYLALGRALERTREQFLPELAGVRQALVLGDGDGRFTARLLAVNQHVQIEAVDLSHSMLALLRARTQRFGSRVRTRQADVRTYTPNFAPDLVTTHFLLDCLTQPEVEALIDTLTPALAPDALWLVSEFRIPGGLARLPAWLYVRSLYLAFGLLTGLRVRKLPDHATPLLHAGFCLVHERRRLWGLLTAQLWQRHQQT